MVIRTKRPARITGLTVKVTTLLSLAALLGGCGNPSANLANSDRPTEIDFWAFGTEADAAARLLAEFEANHPGLRVRMQQIPWLAAHEKLLTAFAGDTLPDVCQLGNTWISEFQALGALEPLDEWIAASPVVSADQFFSGAWETNLIADRAYGVPWYVDTRLLFYQQEQLAEVGAMGPPTTWAEWRDVAQRLRNAMPADAYPLLMPTNEFEHLTVLGLQTTGDLLREKGRYGNFRSEQFRRAFEFYVGLYESDFAPRVRNTQVTNIYQEFERGRFAMYVTGPWNIGEFRKRLPAEVYENWSAAPMPGPTDEAAGISTAGGCSLVLLASSPRKQQAWKLIEFLSRTDQQLAFYEASGNLPARTSAWDQSDRLGEDRWTRAFEEQLAHVVPPPRVPEWERIAQLIYQAGEAAVDDGQPIGATLDTLDRKVDAVLEKRRWMMKRVAKSE